MIKKLQLKNVIDLNTEKLNIFVGPNNSGKSLILKEINNFIQNSHTDYNLQMLKNIIFDIEEEYIEKIIQNRPVHKGREDYLVLEKHGKTIESYHLETFQNLYSQYPTKDEYFNYIYRKILFSNKILYLNGENRLDAYKEFPYSTKYDSKFENLIQELIDDNKKYVLFSNKIYDAFKLYPEIKLNGSNASLYLLNNPLSQDERLSIRPDVLEKIDKGYNDISISDGRKAYTKIIGEVISNNPELILLDEPEAFLHPPLARKLGKVLTEISLLDDKEIIVSTHSSNFIMGCIESKIDLNILRLTYDDNISTVKVLDNEIIKTLMSDPLLRSTNIIDAIFYKYAIVTESDTDRAFYQEINERLRENKIEWYIEDCLFLNAQNKQTVGRITKALRNIGIPTISIIDFDMIIEGGGEFTSYLNSVNIPKESQKSLTETKTAIKQKFSRDKNGKFPSNGPMKTEGIRFLKVEPGLYETANKFISDLSEYGLFVVPIGELESWLSHLNISGHGPSWLIEIFEKMGDNPLKEDYVKPHDDDVWEFMYKIKMWLENNNRKGMYTYII